MMKSIQIKGFKSLADVTVNLEPVTVLIGRSGSGKSNFVHAMRFLRTFLIKRDINAVAQEFGGWAKIRCATTALPAELSFKIVFDIRGIDGDFTYAIVLRNFQFPPYPMNLVYESLLLRDKPLFVAEKGKYVTPPQVLNIPNANDLILGALTGIQEVAVANVYLTKGMGCYDFPSNVLQVSGQKHFDGLADFGENYLEAFSAIENNLQVLENWKEIIAALRVLDSSIRSVETRQPGRGSIAVAHHVRDKILVLDLEQESEGFRRFLAHLIALYQSPMKQTLVFEEPEKGIHPGALAALAEQLQSCPSAGRGQIIITTHSPELLDKFPVEAIRVVERQDYQTRIGPATEEQLQAVKESLLRPGELLTVDPARIAPATTDKSA